jgi:tRNA threonylcarbamoyladenosine biosynthesis protein TsaB
MSEDTFILGIESSGMNSAVAVSQNGRLMGQISLNMKNIHSRLLASFARDLLKQLGLGFEALSAVAVSAGPGSFTGLRIGFSLAKGLAHVLKIPIVRVPTPDIWAYQQGYSELPVLAVIDAYRENLYAALYSWDGGEMKTDYQPNRVPISDLASIVRSKTLVVGADAAKFQNEIKSICGEKALFPLPFRNQLDNWAFLKLAFARFINGDVCKPELCEPIYLQAFKGVM